MSPTLYHLIFRNNHCGDDPEYDVYEKHTCQEKGCFWTDPEYTGNVVLPGNEAEFVEEYNNNLVEGKVVSYEIPEYIEVER